MSKNRTNFFSAFEEVRFDIAPRHIPLQVYDPRLKGFRILHLSDLHIGKKSSLEQLQRLIQNINKTECDIVALTGDLIEAKVQSIEEKVRLLDEIQHPVYFVSGNHDFVYGLEALKKLLQECGVVVLDGTTQIIHHKEQPILLSGLCDRFAPFFGKKRREKELVQSIQTSSLPKIFLAHQPKDFHYALRAKSALFLCGHTHGGQIWPFGYIVRIVQPFVSGVYYHDNMAIYVSNGLGAWGINRRYKALNELTLLELV